MNMSFLMQVYMDEAEDGIGNKTEKRVLDLDDDDDLHTHP